MPVEAQARTPPVSDDWLQPLHALLAPLAPEAVAVVAGLVPAMKLQWVTRLPEETVIVEPRDAGLIGASGWLFQLPAPAGDLPVGGPLALFVATRNEHAASESALDVATLLVRCTWTLRSGVLDADDARHAAELGEAIHALRNSLNSVLMSAAVITTCADLLPERLQPIAREIEAAASRSVQRLHRLTGLIESRPG